MDNTQQTFSEGGIEFYSENWDEIESNNFDLLASGLGKTHLFKKLGYDVLESGELVDAKTKEKILVKGKENEFINIKTSPKVALISGSHHFVRNIAEYSELLAEKGKLNLVLSDPLNSSND